MERKFIITVLILLASIGLFGLFYEYAGCLLGALSGFLFSWYILFEKKAKFFLNPNSILFTIWIASYGIVSLYAVDRGMAFLGFLKMMAVFFFVGIAMQMDKEQRELLLKAAPMSACATVLLGTAGYFIWPIHNFFYKAERLGGFFQHANVFALFCLLGILIEAKENHSQRYLRMALLILGISLSGSRTVFLMTVAVFFLLAIKEKKRRLPFITLALLMIAGSGVHVLLSGDIQNVEQIYSMLISSSFLRRLLFVKDGLRLLADRPFGLGYLGYYFMQPSAQTGVYSARFIHSDLLQIALDVGIIPCLLFATMLIRSIFSKRTDFYEKLILIVSGIHFAMDFDMEFTVMLFILTLILDFYYGNEVEISSGGKLKFYKVLTISLSFTMLYCGAAMAFHAFGKSDISARMLPIYSEAKIQILQNETDMDRAEKLAKDLTYRNPYIATAHDILALAAYENGDYQTMAREKEQSVDLQKYNMDVYNRYVILLSKGIEAAYAQGDNETFQTLLSHVAGVPNKLKKVQKDTDPLAYKIKKKPNFELEESVQEYVNSVVDIYQ